MISLSYFSIVLWVSTYASFTDFPADLLIILLTDKKMINPIWRLKYMTDRDQTWANLTLPDQTQKITQVYSASVGLTSSCSSHACISRVQRLQSLNDSNVCLEKAETKICWLPRSFFRKWIISSRVLFHSWHCLCPSLPPFPRLLRFGFCSQNLSTPHEPAVCLTLVL